MEVRTSADGVKFKGATTAPCELYVTGKIGFSPDHPMLSHFKYLKAKTSLTPKMTIPSPTVAHFRMRADQIVTDAYADGFAMFDDLAAAYRDAVNAFYGAGCRYLQFDDVIWAYLCSSEQLQQAIWFKLRGHREFVQHGVVLCFCFGGRDVADGLQQSAIIEPVHPFEGGIFDSFE